MQNVRTSNPMEYVIKIQIEISNLHENLTPK